MIDPAGARLRTAAVTLAALVSLAPGAFAQGAASPASADEAFARPLSPGSVALLLQHSAAPGMPKRLVEALQDPRPEVRAIAARVAFTTRHTAIGPALGAALDRETNPAAAAEIVRALALILGAAGDERIARRLPELDSRATSAWLSTMARARPADVWARLSAVRMVDTGEMGKALAHLVATDPRAAEVAFAGLAQTPALEPVYLSFLAALHPAQPLPPWPILAPGLAADATRGSLLQLLIIREAANQPLPAEAVEALRLVDRSPDLAWLSLYRELARRGKTSPPPRQPQRDTILRIDPTALPASFLRDPMLARLDGDETAALRQLVGPSWAPSPLPSSTGRPDRRTGLDLTTGPDGSMTRLARPLSTVLMKDLQSLLACRPVEGNVAVVQVTYRPTGQVRSVVTTTHVDPDVCNQVAAIIAALDVAPGAEPIREGRVDRLVIGLRPGDLSCDRAAPATEATPERVGRRVTAPKKTRNVPPVYPRHVIAERVQGTVIADATITTSGCVVDAVVTQRVNADLDVSALAAIGEWRYQPALVDGTAVPVIMTVTVTFSLH